MIKVGYVSFGILHDIIVIPFNNIISAVPSFLEFENLGKAFSKAKAVVDKEGIPQFYIRSLTELEDFVKEVNNNSKQNSLKTIPGQNHSW